MKKILLFTVLCLFQISFSQVSLDKNKLVKEGVKYKFSQYEEVLHNIEARDYFKKARANKTVGEAFTYLGGFGLGFGLAQALQSEDKKINVNGTTQTVKVEKAKGAWTIVGIGAGLVGIGIPFALAANKHAKRAMALENGEANAFQPHFKLESAGAGVALSYNF